MGYTIGSGKDSVQTPGQTEQDFLARFQAQQPAIVAYKKQHGGDLEGAYQAVTGEAWPAGRSVKVHGDGRAELTKDRTVKKVLGEIGIGAGLAAGGYLAAPAIAGAMGIGGATAGGAGVAGGGLGTGALAAGATIPGAGMATGVGMGGGSLLGTLGTAGSLAKGASMASKLTSAGDMLTQGAGANAAGRRGDAMADANAAQQNNQARGSAAAFNLNAPGARASQVARGDVMSTMKDAPLTGDPRIDRFAGGGLRPSAFGQDTHDAGSALKKQALLALMNKSDQLTPQIAQPQKAGLGENVMAGAGMGMNMLSTLGNYGKYAKYFGG